jgi:hypothetical protein
MVDGEELGDDGDSFVLVPAEAVAANVEWRVAPEWAPAAGDELRVGALPCREEGDNGTKDFIRKSADEIAVVVIPCPFPGHA